MVWPPTQLEVLLGAAGFRQSDVVRALRLSEGFVSMLVRGERRPVEDTLSALAILISDRLTPERVARVAFGE